MSKIFLSDSASTAELESRMYPADLPVYQGFKHLKYEPAFVGRVFIVYTPEGDPLVPKVLGAVKVTDFLCESGYGTSITIEDMETHEEQTFGHIPDRVFDYDFFIAAPTYTNIRYDAKEVNGVVERSLLFGVVIKTAHRMDFPHAGTTYAETPNVFCAAYPEVAIPNLN